MTSDRHQRAAQLIEAGRQDEAFDIANALLNENADDPRALYLMGTLHADSGRLGMAHAFFARAVQISPGRPEAWNNLGMVLQHLWRSEEARDAFRRALKLRPEHAHYLANLATTYVENGDPERAAGYARRALASDPTHDGAALTLGFAQLTQGNWRDGWRGYARSLGGSHRKRLDYGLAEWHGEPGAAVVIYGEQGLGDEVMYASCLPDAQRVAERLALDCDRRLQSLFARSFQDIEVHGTRHDPSNDWCDRSRWTHQCPIGRLPELFRGSWTACPGTPYLRPADELLVMYEALQAMQAGDRPRVGLAWSGGIASSGASRREMGLEAWRPFIEAHPEYAFFSLQYRDSAADEIAASGLPVQHFRAAVGKGAAMDHTAAYIRCLDLVLGPPTTAHHLAGAMGVSSVTLVPALHGWMFGAYQGDRFCWFRSCALFRQRAGESWIDTVRRFDDEHVPVVRAVRGGAAGALQLAA